MNKGVKEHIIFRGKAPAEDLVRDEGASSSSGKVVETIQSETEEPSNTHMPTALPLKDTAFEFVKDVPKPVSLFLLQTLKAADN